MSEYYLCNCPAYSRHGESMKKYFMTSFTCSNIKSTHHCKQSGFAGSEIMYVITCVTLGTLNNKPAIIFDNPLVFCQNGSTSVCLPTY